MMKISKNIQYIGMAAVLGLVGCATYHIDSVHSITNTPNNSPVPVLGRQENDVCINLQMHGNADADATSFNYGDIILRHTAATGLLCLDYTINDQWFTYGKMGFGIWDDLYLAGNLGIGIYHVVGSVSMQYYLFVGFSQLYSYEILSETPWGSDETVSDTAIGKSIGIEPGFGFQIITNRQNGYLPHFYGSIDLQLLRYCHTRSYLPIIIPTIGAIENVGKNNQLLLSIECPVIFPEDMETIADIKPCIWPTISLGWTFRTGF